jgi:hypothetical protein
MMMTKANVKLQIVLPSDLQKQLKKRASGSDLSMGQLVRKFIREGLPLLNKPAVNSKGRPRKETLTAQA